MKLNFKKFLDLFKDPTPEKPKREMTIDKDQAEFECDVLFNELKKRGFKVAKHSWNNVNGQIGPLQWGAFIGGINSDHDKWDLRHVDTTDKYQQEVYSTNEADWKYVVNALEAWRQHYAKKEK